MTGSRPGGRLTGERPPAGGHPSAEPYIGRQDRWPPPTPGWRKVRDRLSRLPGRRPSRTPRRRGAVLLAGAVICFAAGLLANAVILHFGAKTGAANVVIGEEVTPHRSTASTVPRPPPPRDATTLTWGRPLLVDPSTPIASVSCPTDGFCVAVDGRGQALVYTGGAWGPGQSIDGSTQINSISCPTATFCMAVDQQGGALSYNGANWSAPERIDKTVFPDLTSVSCSSPAFCAAVDGDGNGLIYTGGRWSTPTQVDPGGWTQTSQGVPSISCPADQFCVGVDADNNALYYLGTWQGSSTMAGTTGVSAIKYRNLISCSSSSFCVASQNLGSLVTYDGTQWSQPVAADPGNYLAAVSCSSSNFCLAADSLLPPGFNDYSSNGNGQVVAYNDRSWSAPREVDNSGSITAISCSSSNFCALTDDSGHVVIGAG